MLRERFDAPIEHLWQLISNFNGLAKFHVAIVESRVEGEGIGSIRTLDFVDGATVVEELVSIDHGEFKLIYRIIDSPFPFTEYVSTMKLTAPNSLQTDFEWSANFINSDDEEEAEIVSLLEDYYCAGFSGIRKFIYH